MVLHTNVFVNTLILREMYLKGQQESYDIACGRHANNKINELASHGQLMIDVTQYISYLTLPRWHILFKSIC